MDNEMYHAYFRHNFYNASYVVYNNLETFFGRKDILLATHRKEKGLHFQGKAQVDHEELLLNLWPKSISRFPKHPWILDYGGKHVGLY